MKKLIAGLLVFVLCCCCILASADDPKKITFQSIPWLSTPQQVSSLLYESGFTGFEFGEFEKELFATTARENKRKRGTTYSSILC